MAEYIHKRTLEQLKILVVQSNCEDIPFPLDQMGYSCIYYKHMAKQIHIYNILKYRFSRIYEYLYILSYFIVICIY